MTIKTVAVYSCTIFSILIIIISLATNYWCEYETKHTQIEGAVSRFHVGLFEICETVYHNHGEDNHDDGDSKSCVDYVPNIDDYANRRNALIAMYIIAIILTLIAFVFVTVYCVTAKYYFPVKRTAVCYFISAVAIIIGLIIYTDAFYNKEVAFSWSYGAGWSCVAMYIITIVLLFADK